MRYPEILRRERIISSWDNERKIRYVFGATIQFLREIQGEAKGTLFADEYYVYSNLQTYEVGLLWGKDCAFPTNQISSGEIELGWPSSPTPFRANSIIFVDLWGFHFKIESPETRIPYRVGNYSEEGSVDVNWLLCRLDVASRTPNVIGANLFEGVKQPFQYVRVMFGEKQLYMPLLGEEARRYYPSVSFPK